MANVVAIAGGIVAVILGFCGLVGWWSSFLTLLKGAIPPILILGGLLAVAIAISNIKDEIRAKKEEGK